jgi:hypothetical protein
MDGCEFEDACRALDYRLLTYSLHFSEIVITVENRQLVAAI